jgi:hypothetical protein
MSKLKEKMELIIGGMNNPRKIPPYIKSRLVSEISSVKYGIGYTTSEFHTKVGVLSVKIPKNSYYSKRAPKEYEPQVVSQLAQILDSDSIFYDIGSFFGYHVKVATLAGVPPSQIHAFEANESRALLLKQNSPDDDIQINNTIVAPRGGGIGVVTIDEYVKNNAPPDVIKIDTEGAEYGIIKGAKRTLREYSPSLLIEVHTFKTNWDDSDLISLLASNGYRIGTVYHQMLRTGEEREINWLPESHEQPILEEKGSSGPYLLVARPH